MDFPAALGGHVARLESTERARTDYHFGATCQIGDLDGDGKGEVVAAAALNRSSAGHQARRRAWRNRRVRRRVAQWHGVHRLGRALSRRRRGPSGYTIDLRDDSPSPVTRIDGSASNPNNSELGEELLAGLDYDGDGAEDLFLGDLAGDGGNGVISGARPRDLQRRRAQAATTVDIAGLIASPPAGVRHTMILGPGPSSIGADTAIHGDYDGDGLGDLVVLQPKDSPPRAAPSAGSVHVIYGEVGGWPAVIDLAPADLPSPEAVRIVEIDGAHGAGRRRTAATPCATARRRRRRRRRRAGSLRQRDGRDNGFGPTDRTAAPSSTRRARRRQPAPDQRRVAARARAARRRRQRRRRAAHRRRPHSALPVRLHRRRAHRRRCSAPAPRGPGPRSSSTWRARAPRSTPTPTTRAAAHRRHAHPALPVRLHRQRAGGGRAATRTRRQRRGPGSRSTRPSSIGIACRMRQT